MPETGALIGTPASISESVEPQTEPIDDEPFDSSVSETRRIVYGNTSSGGMTACERPLGERAVADVAALGAAHAAGLPDRERREVVVVHVAPVALERQVVDPLALFLGAQRQQRHDLRLAAGEERRAVRARHHRDLALDRADRLPERPSGRRLSTAILRADEALVDRVARLADVALVNASSSPDSGSAAGNGSLTPATIGRTAGCRLADLSSFESCSASVSSRSSASNCSRTGPGGDRPLLLEQHARATCASGAPAGLGLRSSSS